MLEKRGADWSEGSFQDNWDTQGPVHQQIVQNYFCLETESSFVAQAGLKLAIFLPLLLRLQACTTMSGKI
jgi:hypothetical protein